MWAFFYWLIVFVGMSTGMFIVRRRGPPPMTFVLPGLFLGLVGLSNATHHVGENLESLVCMLAGALALGMVWQAATTDWDNHIED